MNNQEALNKACEFLMRQGCAALEDGSCQYLTDDGKRCAIGALLTDEQAKRASIKNYGVQSLTDIDESVAELLSGCDISFLKGLQNAHDSAKGYFATRFPLNIEVLAEQWNLEVPECVKK